MTLSVHQGRAILITTSTKLLDTKYAFCGFNDDLYNRDHQLIMNIIAIWLVLVGTKSGIIVMCKILMVVVF